MTPPRPVAVYPRTPSVAPDGKDVPSKPPPAVVKKALPDVAARSEATITMSVDTDMTASPLSANENPELQSRQILPPRAAHDGAAGDRRDQRPPGWPTYRQDNSHQGYSNGDYIGNIATQPYHRRYLFVGDDPTPNQRVGGVVRYFPSPAVSSNEGDASEFGCSAC